MSRISWSIFWLAVVAAGVIPSVRKGEFAVASIGGVALILAVASWIGMPTRAWLDLVSTLP